MRSCHKKSERGPCNQRGTWRKPEAMQVKMPSPTYRSVVIYHNRAWDTRPVGLLFTSSLLKKPPSFLWTKASPIGGTHFKGNTKNLFSQYWTIFLFRSIVFAIHYSIPSTSVVTNKLKSPVLKSIPLQDDFSTFSACNLNVSKIIF